MSTVVYSGGGSGSRAGKPSSSRSMFERLKALADKIDDIPKKNSFQVDWK